MPETRPVRPIPPGAAPAPGAQPARPQRAKPDPAPMRIVFGMAGLASATALLTAMLPSVTPSTVAVVEAVDTTTTTAAPEPSVLHVTRVVTLDAGQTAPPNAPVVVKPKPTPRVRVKVVTKQSG
jgi:hypothetical protein